MKLLLLLCVTLSLSLVDAALVGPSVENEDGEKEAFELQPSPEELETFRESKLGFSFTTISRITTTTSTSTVTVSTHTVCIAAVSTSSCLHFGRKKRSIPTALPHHPGVHEEEEPVIQDKVVLERDSKGISPHHVETMTMLNPREGKDPRAGGLYLTSDTTTTVTTTVTSTSYTATVSATLTSCTWSLNTPYPLDNCSTAG